MVNIPVFPSKDANTKLISDINCLEAEITGKHISTETLLIGVWSLSELPIELRSRLLNFHYNYYLFAYQWEWGENDNRKYFSDWQQHNSSIECYEIEIGHLFGNSYLFGKRQTNNKLKY